MDFTSAILPAEPVEIERLAAASGGWAFSSFRDHGAVQRSIEQIGLLRPVFYWRAEPANEPMVISGRLRLKALTELGHKTVLACEIKGTFSAAMAVALAENASRGFSEAEEALIWDYLLVKHLSEPEAVNLLEKFGRDLAITKAPKLRQKALLAAKLPQKALAMLADERLDIDSAAVLAAWPAGDQEAVIDLFANLKPSRQKRRQWLEWLSDLGRIENKSVAAILASPGFLAVVTPKDGEAAGGKLEDMARQYIWARRHPLVSRLTAERRAQIKDLKLPPGLKLAADPDFEDIKFGLNFEFSGYDDFISLAGELGRISESGAFKKLLGQDDGK